ncbi:hypothetical protein SDJN02_15077, partial [Cucurbita argyrosperma subsp. argyrosperma]
MNHPHLPPPPPTKVQTECGNCGSHGRWILHHVRLRGINRRLCTSCVLRLHPTSFCPSCFHFYDPSVSPPHPSNRFKPASSVLPFYAFPLRRPPSCCSCAAKNRFCFDGVRLSIVAPCRCGEESAGGGCGQKKPERLLSMLFFFSLERELGVREASMEVSGSGNMETKGQREGIRNLGSMVKTENSLETPAVPTLNTGTTLTQRRESLNGFVRQMSMVKNEAAASLQETAEADRLQSNNTIPSSEKEKSGNCADNGDVENVQNDHKTAL